MMRLLVRYFTIGLLLGWLRRNAELDTRTFLMMLVIGALEVVIIATWMIDDATVAAWLSR